LRALVRRSSVGDTRVTDLLGQSLGPDAAVVLEATGNAAAITRPLRPGAGRLVTSLGLV
jgi:hypothetical protein